MDNLPLLPRGSGSEIRYVLSTLDYPAFSFWLSLQEWKHMHINDILSMPDKWEYPWFATYVREQLRQFAADDLEL